MSDNERAVPATSAADPGAGGLAAVQRMTDVLVRAAPLAEVYDEALAALRAATGADRASVLVFDSADVMRFVAWDGLSDAYRRAVDGHSPWRPDSVDARTLVVADAAEDTSLGEYRDVILGEGIRALVFVPLVYAAGVLGKFMLYFDTPRQLTAREIRLAETIAGHVTVAIVRERTETALRKTTREFETLAEHAPDVIARLDRHLRHLYVNPAIREKSGLEREAFIGRTNAELGMPEEVVSQWTTHLETAFRTGTPQRFEFSFPGSGGTLHFESMVTPEQDEAGVIETVLAVTRDVTARWKADRTLRLLARTGDLLVSTLNSEPALRQFAELLAQHVADACRVDVLDEDGVPRCLAVAGRDEAACSAASPPDVPLPEVATTRSTTSAGDERVVLTVPLRVRDQTFGALTLVGGSNGRGFDEDDITLATELAERAALALDNAQLYEDAVAANRVKSSFLATMSHELRTPLNAILGYADLMQLGIGGELGTLHREQLGRIQASSRHLLTLIEGLLTFSRLEASSERASREPVDIAALVDEAVALVEPAAREKRLALDSRGTARPVIVHSDPGKLLQILLNLLGNAVKFTDAGAVDATVEPCDAEVLVHVRDTGRGIAPEHLERVFEPFWQAEQGTTRRSEGAGLGLAVCRQLADLLGASIDVSSTPGAGSTFTLRLPTADAPRKRS